MGKRHISQSKTTDGLDESLCLHRAERCGLIPRGGGVRLLGKVGRAKAKLQEPGGSQAHDLREKETQHNCMTRLGGSWNPALGAGITRKGLVSYEERRCSPLKANATTPMQGRGGPIITARTPTKCKYRTLTAKGNTNSVATWMIGGPLSEGILFGSLSWVCISQGIILFTDDKRCS